MDIEGGNTEYISDNQTVSDNMKLSLKHDMFNKSLDSASLWDTNDYDEDRTPNFNSVHN